MYEVQEQIVAHIENIRSSLTSLCPQSNELDKPCIFSVKLVEQEVARGTKMKRTGNVIFDQMDTFIHYRVIYAINFYLYDL